MLDAIEQFPYWRTVFSVFVLFVFGTSAFEIIEEFASGETIAEMADDLFRFAFSAVMLGIFILQHFSQQRALSDLQGQLDKARGQFGKISKDTQLIANQYRAVMQKQLDAWQLTTSEQDVAIMLLKGLSFREIAKLRATMEKTVRQQASSIYRKAGVASRHELAAWFFEDMLEAPTVRET